MVLPENVNADRRPTCGDCRFYVDHRLIQDGREVGDCHALPPLVVPVGGAAVPVRPNRSPTRTLPAAGG